MTTQGKLWGKTQSIIANNFFEFHRIEFKEGYKCSEHLHEHKINFFYVESGKLLIRVWQNDQKDLIDETILGPGEYTQVLPGKFHQFEGLESGVAFELYWGEFSHDDIIRRTIGSSIY